MEKVQSETWVGAMTPEQILELAHEAGFPRDTIFYRSDQFITFANAIAQRTRDALKAQAGEPDFYVRRRPSPGYEVVSSSDPMAQPAYLHSTTERRVIPEDVRKVMEMAMAALKQPLGFTSSREIDAILQSAITALRNALNAAPKGEV